MEFINEYRGSNLELLSVFKNNDHIILEILEQREACSIYLDKDMVEQLIEDLQESLESAK